MIFGYMGCEHLRWLELAYEHVLYQSLFSLWVLLSWFSAMNFKLELSVHMMNTHKG